MPFLEDIKRMIERVMGAGRPQAVQIHIRKRMSHAYKFADDGETPNNPNFPLVFYRSPVILNLRSIPPRFSRSCSPPTVGKILGATASMIFYIFIPRHMKF